MPSGWELARLEDLITIKHGFAFPGAEFSEEPTDFVLLTPGNFRIGGGFKADKIKYFRGQVPKEFILEPGDLIVTMTDLSKNMDTLGLPARVPDFGAKIALHNQRLGLVQVVSTKLDSNFLFYILCSAGYREEVMAGSSGTTVHHTSPKRILNYEFELPPLSEQRGIAATLSPLDEKIESNNRAFQLGDQLLVERFGFLAAQREGAIVTVGSLGSELREKLGPARATEALVLSAVSSGELLASRDVFEKQVHSASIEKYLFVPRGAFAYNPSRANIGSIGVNDKTDFGAVSPVYVVFRPQSKWTAWIDTALRTAPVRADIKALSSGSVRQVLKYADLASIEIPDPGEKALLEFNKWHTLWTQKRNSLSRETAALTVLRNALLPELLSGRIRAPEARGAIA